MNTKSKIVLAAVAGAALGATAIQGLHAQAKLKAYSVGEVELIGTLPPDYLPAVRKAIDEMVAGVAAASAAAAAASSG